jgi:hypothetical protein
MTTIVADARKGLMACDSRVQIEGQWWPATKVIRIDDYLVGGAGDTGTILKAYKWLSNGRKNPPPKLPDNFCLLTLGPDGLRYWANNLQSEVI